MTTIQIVASVALLILSIALIVLILVQRSKEESLGSSFGDLGGGFEGQRGSSLDMVLSKWTKRLSILLAILVVAADIAIFYFGK